MSVVFLVQRIGPYHDARLKAWARLEAEMFVIEFRPVDTVYAWAEVTDGDVYRRFKPQSTAELLKILEAHRPKVIVCTGYADAEVHIAMDWALRGNIPLVVCNESNWQDQSRNLLTEYIKSWLLKAFVSGVYGGKCSREYLLRLGMHASTVWGLWDVVDNQHFDSNRLVSELESRDGTPYFLCSARFIPKKNLSRLIEAYRHYVRSVSAPWPLIISGSGELADGLCQQVKDSGLSALVGFPGFLQYDELPALYAKAGAFVLPSVSEQWGLVVNEAMASGLPVLVSERCGCVSDLVDDGCNGFSFNPFNVEQLAGLLTKIAALTDEQRATMGRRSQEIIAAYSPEAFAVGVQAAVSCALDRRGRRVPLLTRWLVRLLAMRAR